MLLTHLRPHAPKVHATLERIGSYFDARAIWLAFVEVLFTLLVTNFFLIFAVFVYFVNTDAAVLTSELLVKIFKENVKTTEVLIYVLGLVAPALWIMVHSWNARRHITFFWLLLFLQFGIVVFSAYIYGLSKSKAVMNAHFVDAFALYSLAAALIIWYVTLVYHRAVLTKIDREVAQPMGGTVRANNLMGRIRKSREQ